MPSCEHGQEADGVQNETMERTDDDALPSLDGILCRLHALGLRLERLAVDVNIAFRLEVLIESCGLSHRGVSDEKNDSRTVLCGRDEWELCW